MYSFKKGGEFSLLFRDTTKNVVAINATKMSRAENTLTVFGNSTKTTTLETDATFFAMYFSSSASFDNLIFQVTHTLVN